MKKRSDNAMMLVVTFFVAFFSVLLANAEKTPRKYYWVQHVDDSSTSTEIFVDYVDEEVSTITLNWNILPSDIWYV